MGSQEVGFRTVKGWVWGGGHKGSIRCQVIVGGEWGSVRQGVHHRWEGRFIVSNEKEEVGYR